MKHEFIDTTPVDDDGCLSYREIAKELGCSPTLVQRIERKALEKVRKRLLFHPAFSDLMEGTLEPADYVNRHPEIQK